MCTITHPDGTIKFFPSGAVIKRGNNVLGCNGLNWTVMRGDTKAPGTGGDGGGVAAP